MCHTAAKQTTVSVAVAVAVVTAESVFCGRVLVRGRVVVSTSTQLHRHLGQYKYE